MITRGRVALSTIFLSSAVAFVVAATFHQVEATPQETHDPEFSIDDRTVSIPAKAFLVLDVETGEVIAKQNANQELPIASITKLPAAAVWREVVSETETTTIVWADVVAEGRAGKLQVGDVLTNHDLLFPLVLESSNDAAAAMERVTEGEIVSNMNKIARDLSLTTTQFIDASGLSALNVSTAAELATLTRHLKEKDPHLFDIAALNQYIKESTGWVNNNPFSAEKEYKGGKHGFTYEANRTAVAVFEEPFPAGNREVLYVVLGSDDLKKDVDVLRQFVRESVHYQ